MGQDGVDGWSGEEVGFKVLEYGDPESMIMPFDIT